MANHTNLCDYADDEQSLYKVWDDDLKKTMRKRQFSEYAAFLALIAAIVAWKYGKVDLIAVGIYFGVAFLYASIKFMIDESNVNYLMHQWDLRDAIERFRRDERRRFP